ncbi:GD25927 [Drosophila simulans]|uniref:GD25927 n=1 Tax=Drosophila simulans TaxID=7240 RepID=B4QB60_DROSI|nr:GD25927 [Drosophila simulans]
MTSTGKENAIVNYVVQPGAEVAVSEATEVPDPPTIKANHRRLSNVKITLKSLRAPVTDLPPNRHSDSDSDSWLLGLIALEAQHGKPDIWLALKTHLNDDGLRWREGDMPKNLIVIFPQCRVKIVIVKLSKPLQNRIVVGGCGSDRLLLVVVVVAVALVVLLLSGAQAQ